MTHYHGHDGEGEGFFAANMMLLMIAFLVGIALLIGLVVWQPWDADAGDDGDGGGVDVDINGGTGGDDSSGGTDSGSGSDSGGDSGSGTDDSGGSSGE
jgi:hypothetical protein